MAFSPGVSKTEMRRMRLVHELVEMQQSSNMHLVEHRTREGYKDKQKLQVFERLIQIGERMRLSDATVTRAKALFAAFRDNREHLQHIYESTAACLIAAVEESEYNRLHAKAVGTGAKAAQSSQGHSSQSNGASSGGVGSASRHAECVEAGAVGGGTSGTLSSNGAGSGATSNGTSESVRVGADTSAASTATADITMENGAPGGVVSTAALPVPPPAPIVLSAADKAAAAAAKLEASRVAAAESDRVKRESRRRDLQQSLVASKKAKALGYTRDQFIDIDAEVPDEELGAGDEATLSRRRNGREKFEMFAGKSAGEGLSREAQEALVKSLEGTEDLNPEAVDREEYRAPS